MYQNYEARKRPDRKIRLLQASLVMLAGALLATGVYLFLARDKTSRPVSETDGVKQVSSVANGHLAFYDGESWVPRFWAGINLGATLPGHAPGDLAPAKEDYLRWFGQMKEMNSDVVRVYTILSPSFYEALYEFNSTREDPLWLIQGVWSPEEELIGEDENGRNAYDPEITEEFHREISDAVRVVHGDAELPERHGHASGRFRTDVSEYMLGWIVGTEWYPYAVKATDDENRGMSPYSGTYFRATEDATPFESWLAEALDVLAEEEMEYGWQHPVSLTNWPTTDPLSHPNEPNPKEDLISVDPMRVEPTDAWRAGYFAQYHVYPYYPDFLRYEQKYQTYRDAEDNVDPYAGYLNELRAHHEGIPLFVGEFGVPTSRGMAHRGPLERDQGYHTEEEQGEIDADMLEAIRNEGFDGALLFAWHDEWFKFTWNTTDLELPGSRRQMWRNRLTNEENFGVLAAEAGESAEETVFIDGEAEDWDRLEVKETQAYPGFDLTVSHDEAYLYLLLQKREGGWNFPREELDIGFGTLPGGSRTADPAPGLNFPGGGIQFLLQIRGEKDSRMLVNSAYDQYTWLYANQLNQIPAPRASKEASAGDFLPWKLALNREFVLPQTRQRIPFEEIEVGVMVRGVTDPSNPEFNNLADWYSRGNVLEIRVPWMLLGFTDPSSLRVWDYPYEVGRLESVKTEGLWVYPAVRPARDSRRTNVEPLLYTWEGWEQPTFHERKKKSFEILSEAYENSEQLVEPLPR